MQLYRSADYCRASNDELKAGAPVSACSFLANISRPRAQSSVSTLIGFLRHSSRSSITTIATAAWLQTSVRTAEWYQETTFSYMRRFQQLRLRGDRGRATVHHKS